VHGAIIFRHTEDVASLSDLSRKNRLFMATYRFRALDPVPFTRPAKPLQKARVALVTTGGVHLPSQFPFDDGVKCGDTSFREIPADVDLATLGIAHKSDAFDQSGFLADRNLGFPLERLREMDARGEIGSLNGRALSFMGSITAPGRLVKETAPAAAALLAADGVDVAFLVPL
jgi:D-proline reductase (dithiol) PrdB